MQITTSRTNGFHLTFYLLANSDYMEPVRGLYRPVASTAASGVLVYFPAFAVVGFEERYGHRGISEPASVNIIDLT